MVDEKEADLHTQHTILSLQNTVSYLWSTTLDMLSLDLSICQLYHNIWVSLAKEGWVIEGMTTLDCENHLGVDSSFCGCHCWYL